MKEYLLNIYNKVKSYLYNKVSSFLKSYIDLHIDEILDNEKFKAVIDLYIDEKISTLKVSTKKTK